MNIMHHCLITLIRQNIAGSIRSPHIHNKGDLTITSSRDAIGGPSVDLTAHLENGSSATLRIPKASLESVIKYLTLAQRHLEGEHPQ